MSTNSSHFVAVCRTHASQRANRRAYLFSDETAENEELTFGSLDLAARAIGAAIQERDLVGERVLLLFDSGPDFVRSFFGCLYGGAIAVPVNLPTRKQRLEKIRAILIDSGAKVALTTAQIAADLKAGDLALECLELGDLLSASGLDRADSWRELEFSSESPAFLQYTSGSTGSPKGVVVTHGNLLANEEMIKRSFGHDEDTVFVGWLPLFHDMGLVGNVLQPAYLGIPCVLVPPIQFVQQPWKWLQLISQYKATTSGAPNFAYELCVHRIPDDELANVDLSSWKVAFNGAEPIRAETMERFIQKFGPYGFRRETFYPCYGMAEATLFISGGIPAQPPVIRSVRAEDLELGDLASQSARGTSESSKTRILVGCGRSWMDEKILIVDPNTSQECPPRVVGEIWVAGPNVAGGYWNNPEATKLTFQATTAAGEGPFLRTGDLGFIEDGELFVTGRIKDVIIIAGRNHYPQDIEQTTAKSHPAFMGRPGAAVPLLVDNREDVAVVQEVGRSFLSADTDDPEVGRKLRARIREAINAEHGITPRMIVLIGPASLPMTTSGKVQRSRCRAMLREKSFVEVLVPTVKQPVLAGARTEGSH